MLAFIVVAALFAVIAGTDSALAIPSPELVIGSLSSISQLVAILSAIIGGGAAVVGARKLRSGETSKLPRVAIRTAIVLMVLLIAAIGLNLYQYAAKRAEQQTRLEETLLRPSKTPGGSDTDPDQKELTYSEQLRHPLRMSTDEANKLLAAARRGENSDYIFLDVRETAEREMGTLHGVTFIRFPDLPAAKLDFTGKKAILFCHNGNRSSETCEVLAKQGIDCRFIVGGLEKWVVEGRSVEGLAVRTLDQLRAIPDYPNHYTLLDTSDVHRLVSEQKAIFVDIRYPTDFGQEHIPNAINLNLRRTPTPELQNRITELPKRPIILPCYDRRGCFFAEVMGYELSRAGYDVRGRYTHPWEYYVTRPRPPHVEQWIQETNTTYWTKAARYLARAVSAASDHIGLFATILILALVSRLLVLPFSLKAERDQIRARVLAPELESLKRYLKDDPARLARAIREFYRQNGFTPVRNLFALLFLPVMALAVTAVQMTATKKVGSFLWLPDLAGRDSNYVLPLLFAALVALYLDLAFARALSHRLWIWLVTLPLLTATGALLSAAADLYIIASALLLLLQRAFVVGVPTKLAHVFSRIGRDDMVVSLSETGRLADCGNKAYRLAQLRAQGFAVPDGLVLTPRFIENFSKTSSDWRRRQLDRLWQRLGSPRIAVRSSAFGEDGDTYSFAGVFETELNIDRPGLEPAIEKVIASFGSHRAGSYLEESQVGGIILQRMIDAEYAGVLFTHHPSAGGLCMVEMVHGTAEDLVSGAIIPESYSFGRISGQPIESDPAPIDLSMLLSIGRRAEEFFGAPQDIEWAYHDGIFYLIQSRNITRLLNDGSPMAMIERERMRVLDLAKVGSPDEVVFVQNELAELLPRPTPLSLSLQQSLWESGGSVDLACRSLGLAYGVQENSPEYIVTVFGRLYLNKQEEHARALHIGPLAVRKLLKSAGRIEQEFRDGFLANYLSEVSLLEAIDFDRMPISDLFGTLARLRRNFINSTHVEVDIINIAASIYLEHAKEQLKKHGLNPAEYLAHIPENIYGLALAEAARAPRSLRRAVLLKRLSHRALFDYELAEPRYCEAPKSIDALNDTGIPPSLQTQEPTAEVAAIFTSGEVVSDAVRRARRFQALKEDAKHHSLRELAVLRRAVLAVERRFGLDGLVFYLTLDEVMKLQNQDVAELRETAQLRRSEAERFLEVAPLPTVLTLSMLEIISHGADKVIQASEGVIRGSRVSGSGVVEGRATVVTPGDAERGLPIVDFRDGDIIVASMIHPAWLPYFRRVAGLVCEVGGWLSHSAILAREYEVPMIVGTQGLAAIMDGNRLRLHPDGTVEIVTKTTRQHVLAAAAE